MEGKTLKICGCLVALWGAELGKSFPETLPLKTPELLSYRELGAFLAVGCGKEALAPSTEAKLDAGRGAMLCF